MNDAISRENMIIEEALIILESRLKKFDVLLSSPSNVKDFLTLKLAQNEHEVFGVLYLNTKNFLIQYVEEFKGTIDSSSVYPREIVKKALSLNASSVIFVHNHPSYITIPSDADLIITKKLKEALALVDVKVIDHFIVGGENLLSFAEKGLI